MVLSFYLVEIKPGEPWRRTWLCSIDHVPTDWIELKMMLEEVMWQVYIEHGRRTKAIITLERHVRGRFTMRRSRRYGFERIPTKREDMGWFRLEFKPKTREITVKEASFGYNLSHPREDFYFYERDRQYRLPPLIPREHMNLNDPRSFLMEPSALRYTDYSRKPNPLYAYELEHHRRMGYVRTARLSYDREGRHREYTEEEGEEE